jgi:hypothetical protein
MRLTQAWAMQTKSGQTFLFGVIYGGNYIELDSAVKWNERFYGINITNRKGGIPDLLEMISEKDVITFSDIEWNATGCNNYDSMKKYQIEFKNKKIIHSNEVRFITELRGF